MLGWKDGGVSQCGFRDLDIKSFLGIDVAYRRGVQKSIDVDE